MKEFRSLRDRTKWLGMEPDLIPSLQLHKANALCKGQEGYVRAERGILKNASLISLPGGVEWILRFSTVLGIGITYTSRSGAVLMAKVYRFRQFPGSIRFWNAWAVDTPSC